MIFQSLSDRKIYEGTGILAIAKKIIEKHGLITVYGKMGGCRFIMVLP
jgi:nitrogen-specific signal transduction histidine kinase